MISLQALLTICNPAGQKDDVGTVNTLNGAFVFAKNIDWTRGKITDIKGQPALATQSGKALRTIDIHTGDSDNTLLTTIKLVSS